MGARMSALVTGAGGFVGSAVVRALLDAGYPVRAMVRGETEPANLAGLDVEIVRGDLTDPPSLWRAIQGCRYVLHVAADYRLWARDPRELYRNNYDGTVNVMRAAVATGVERVVYTSSVATLGVRADGRPADERTPAGIDEMIGHYKRSKFRAEQAVRALVREEPLPAVIVNPSAPVGPRDVKPTPTGRMIADAAAGAMPAFVDTGLNIVHVDDVARGHVLALTQGEVGERYILGGEDMSLRAILETVAALAGRRPPRWRLPHGLVLPVASLAETWARLSGRPPRLTVDGLRMARKCMYFSSAKAERALGYRPRPAREALGDAVAWFREHGYLGSS